MSTKYDEAATKVARLERQIAEIIGETASENMSPGQRSKIQDLKRGIEKAREEQREALLEGAESGELDSYNVNDGLSRGREESRDTRVWDDPLTGRENVSDIRSRALTAIERMSDATDSIRETATRMVEQHDDRHGSIARLAAVASDPTYVRAFERIIQNPSMPMLSEREVATVRRVNDLARAMSLTDNAGGFLVPFQLDPTVVITSDGSTNPIRQIARKVVATSDVWNGVSSAAVSWSWDSEATEVSDDATTFAGPAITVHKAAGFVPISIEAAMDAANVAGEVSRLLAFGKDTLESAAFTTGSGSGQPTGIITALSGGSYEVSPTTGGTFGPELDVYLLDEALPARYRANGSWLGAQAILNDVRQAETTNGALKFPSMQNENPTLLGSPAYEASDMSSTITTGQHVLLVGDFTDYVIADRVGTTVEFIQHLFATGNNRPSGQRGWYAFYRVGADSVNDAAFRVLAL